MSARRHIGRLLRRTLAEPRYALRSLWQRLRGRLAYVRGNGRAAPPGTVRLFLTPHNRPAERANAAQAPQDLLSRKEIRQLLDDVAGFRPTIVLCGEPLLHPEFAGIVQDVKADGLRLHVVTDASLLDNVADLVVDFGMDELFVSLDGPREVHDEIRGAPGSFDRVVENLERLRQEQRERGKKTPVVNVTGAVSELGYERLPELIPIANRLGAGSLTIRHLVFQGPDTADSHRELFEGAFATTCAGGEGLVLNRLPNIDAEKMIAVRREMEGARSRADVSFRPHLSDNEIREWYGGLAFAPRLRGGRCRGPWMTGRVFADGGVGPFHALGFVAGNLRQTPFPEIWNNEAYVRFRRTLKQCGPFPLCSRCTELYPL